ncbi:MAG TPA: hypothetical protein PK954_11670, partial [Anaerolineales bacterium]|nr:hypothetical protein [Anaerolineales bacterium]
NAKRMRLEIDDEPFDLTGGMLHAYQRVLDLRTGVLTRRLEWTSPGGRRIEVVSERLVCLARKHVFALRYTVRAIDFSGVARLTSAIEGEVKNLQAGDDPRVGSTITAPPLALVSAEAVGDGLALIHRTRNSGFTLVSA